MGEGHGGELGGHFGMNKTIEILKDHCYQPRMKIDVHRVVFNCTISYKAKSPFHQRLYTPLPTPNSPWKDVSIDFILDLPRTCRGHNLTIMVVD